jgi:glycosyltransferase involved in cell wall biosynthesis
VGDKPARLKRVLCAILLEPALKFGSLEEQICHLAAAFRERGSLFLPVFHCLPRTGNTNQFAARGVRAECLDLGRFRPSTLLDLARLVSKDRIEVVHWHFCEPIANGYLWGLSVLRPAVKHFFTDHNSRYSGLRFAKRPPRRVVRFVKRTLLRRYRRVLCVSRFVMECLQEEQSWSNLTCCLHFINTERFQPDAAARASVRRQLEVGDEFVVLTVAHLIKEKGIHLAVRALAELPAGVVLWVVGEGVEAENLRRLRDELGLGERVRFLGLQRNVAPYMQAADCLACPSLWAEAAGLVNIEANSCGLPVVASRIGGIPEYVEDGTAGLLFPPGDHLALARCVRRLYDEPELCRALGRRAREVVLERFSVERRLDEYLDLYRARG